MSQGPVHGSCSEPPIFAQATHSMHPTIALQEVHVTHVSSLIDWEAERVLRTWALNNRCAFPLIFRSCG